MTTFAGQLDTLVTIKAATDGKDTEGGVTKTWSTTVGTGWFMMRPVGGREALASGQREAMQTYEFTGRYNAAVKPDQQLVVGTRTFAVLAVRPIPREGSMVLVAEERVT